MQYNYSVYKGRLQCCSPSHSIHVASMVRSKMLTLGLWLRSTFLQSFHVLVLNLTFTTGTPGMIEPAAAASLAVLLPLSAEIARSVA